MSYNHTSSVRVLGVSWITAALVSLTHQFNQIIVPVRGTTPAPSFFYGHTPRL